jgi:hypothetical protein
MPRQRFWTRSALALGTAAALGAAFAQQGAAQAARVTTRAATVSVRAAGGGARAATGDGSGDFIVRCFFNNNIAPQNPIDNPGSSADDNLYDFFGNMAGGTATFPGIQSGDYNVTGATMEQNGLSPATNCQDTKDTAGYWNPSPYMVDTAKTATPWQNTNGCPTATTSCKATGPNENFHMRVYYIPHNNTDQQIPDGTIMIAGFPNGCQTVVPGFSPPGCSGNYPVDPDIITYACGANTGTNFGTPLSAWPYDCTNYVNPNTTQDPDDAYSDGQVAMVRFPYCWDGSLTGNFPAPNTQSVNGLPAQTVPGYVAPWIDYSTWKNYKKLIARPANDFAYPVPGTNCANSMNKPYNQTVVQLEERIHLLTYGAGWGDPSSCTGDDGLNWNSPRNAESSNNSGDVNNPKITGQVGDGDGDANVKIGTNLWVPFQCPMNVTAPDPTATTMLSFACSHSGDPNCTIPLNSPKTCAGGTCYVGAYQPTGSSPSFGWETLHADYWQTWQEAQHTLDDPANGGFDHASDVGTFGDVVEDCVNGATANKCPAFIITSQQIPQQVFGNGTGAP